MTKVVIYQCYIIIVKINALNVYTNEAIITLNKCKNTTSIP